MGTHLTCNQVFGVRFPIAPPFRAVALLEYATGEHPVRSVRFDSYQPHQRLGLTETRDVLLASVIEVNRMSQSYT